MMDEQFLRKSLRENATSADLPALTPDCVDAETFAAWTEHALAPTAAA